MCCPSNARGQQPSSCWGEKKIRAGLDLKLKRLPLPGQIVLTVGGLSGGMEYPALHFALLTEGTPAPVRRPAAVPKPSARQKITSYADLAPGDLVVHTHHGIGRFVALVPMQVDGSGDYVKLPRLVPNAVSAATQLD